MSIRGDRRAVSVTVGYILMLVVAMLLMGTVLAGANGLLEGQTERVVDEELTVVGTQLSATLTETDRLAQVARDDANATGGDVAVSRTARLPDRVAGSGYLIEIDTGEIVLSASNPDVEVTVPFPDTEVGIDPTDELSGGDLVIEYDPAADRLEVTG
ncbi:MAG: DUF7266 family protein [Halohasta sp.]